MKLLLFIFRKNYLSLESELKHIIKEVLSSQEVQEKQQIYDYFTKLFDKSFTQKVIQNIISTEPYYYGQTRWLTFFCCETDNYRPNFIDIDLGNNIEIKLEYKTNNYITDDYDETKSYSDYDDFDDDEEFDDYDEEESEVIHHLFSETKVIFLNNIVFADEQLNANFNAFKTMCPNFVNSVYQAIAKVFNKILIKEHDEYNDDPDGTETYEFYFNGKYIDEEETDLDLTP